MDSSINPNILYPILSLERIDDPTRIKREVGGSCFICGNPPQIHTPSLTPKIIFFKSNLKEWKSDDNNETCSACLPLIHQVHSLNRQIISLQMFITNIVAAAHAKKSAKRVHEEMFLKTIKTEDDEEENDEEESNWSTAILGEEIEPDNYNKKKQGEKRRIIIKKNGATSKKSKVAVTNKVEIEEGSPTPIKIEVEQEEFIEVQEEEFSNSENLDETLEKTEKSCGARPSRKCKTVQEPNDFDDENEDEYMQKNEESNEEDYNDLNDSRENDSSSLEVEENFKPAVVVKKYITALKARVKKHGIKPGPKRKATMGGYNCSKCGLRIKEKDRFLLHTKVCVDQEQLTPEEEELLNEKNEGKIFSCNTCFRKFKTRDQVKKHFQIMHQTEKPFPCEFCDLRFSTILRLKKHRIQIHNKDPRPFQCSQCNTQFLRSEQLDLHSCSGRIFPCEHCVQEFKNINELVSHLTSAHPEIPLEFKCFEATCAKKCVTRWALVRHLKKHDPRNFECELCHKKFVTRCELLFHFKVHERRNKEKHLGCEKCPKRFSVQQKLDFHMEFHSKEKAKPFACEKCEVRFGCKEKLEKHLTEAEAHNESLSHLCQYCSKSFPLRKYLIRHELNMHRKKDKKVDKKVECTFCGIVLKYVNYKRHIKNVHKKV